MALNSLLAPINRQLAEHLAGPHPSPGAIEDLTSFITGGWSAILIAWVIDGEDPLDPEALAQRLLRLAADLTGSVGPEA